MKHTTNAPLDLLSPAQWQELTREEYLEFVVPNIFWSASQEDFLPENHPAVMRLQSWADLLDSKLRSEHPEAFAKSKIPEPKIMLAREPAIAAFVEKVAVCYDIPFVFESGAKEPLNSARAFEFPVGLTSNGGFADSDLCLKKSMGEQEISETLSFLNVVQDQCELAFDGNAIRIAQVEAKSCQSKELARWKKFSHANGFAVRKVSNRISFSTGALAASRDEAHAVFILFHELGHYYRAHSILPAARTRFFYTTKGYNAAVKPAPDATAESKGLEIKLLSGIPAVTLKAGQKLRPELAKLLTLVPSEISEICNGRKCEKACAPFLKDFALAPQNREPERIENSFFACAREIKTGPAPGMMSDTAQLRLIRQALGEKVTAAIDAAVEQGVGESFEDTVLGLSDALANLQLRRKQLPSLLEDKNLGWYTEEQEADELGLEYMAKVGLSVEAGLEAQLSIVDYFDKIETKQEISGSECRQRVLAWINGDTSVHVPLGGLNDAHHSSCYRALNIAREIKAHGYKSGLLGQQLLSGDAWSRLKQSLSL